jgi:hypothetical protein
VAWSSTLLGGRDPSPTSKNNTDATTTCVSTAQIQITRPETALRSWPKSMPRSISAESTSSPRSPIPQTQRQQTLTPKSDFGALFRRNLSGTPFKYPAVPHFVDFSFIISFAWLRTFLESSKSAYYSQN